LVNYAFELWSFEVLEIVRGVFVDFLRLLPTIIPLSGALILHIVAAVHTVMEREDLKAMAVITQVSALLVIWGHGCIGLQSTLDAEKHR
jgi:hypothetical protein